jgi:hypothetical protein
MIALVEQVLTERERESVCVSVSKRAVLRFDTESFYNKKLNDDNMKNRTWLKFWGSERN